ncbi:arginine--tRNA ligase [Methyloceanibacter superfactus]|uniref:Arginine--tRNA ligase n=1 Tax=Methyloceanibacter superfactus TaxID=1774969 RepID=A0A1E3VTZ1_9HYPH|nr:arginine--tRNA ligase [Methyloceanibacter superfactus]ODR97008.1 arginine--tRNA ligase [Methyloceanibacter superfactus]
MDVFVGFHGHVLAAVQQLKHDGVVPDDASVEGITLSAPKDPTHGDLATNAAMVLAKPAGVPPRKLAERIVPMLASDPGIDKVEIAGPGFINLTLSRAFWPSVLRMVLEQGDAYGRSAIGKGEAVNVEYVSANPTGPMHVGHCRGAVFGDALANLLAFAGYDVTREYYVNDAGAQVDVLARSAFLRYREALGQDIGDIPEGLYPGDYLKPVGESLASNHGRDLLDMPEAEWLPLVRATALKAMLAMIEDDLASLGIRHDVFFSERSLTDGGHDEVAATIADLKTKGLIYKGSLPPPKGKVDEEWEDREQLLFRATEFGDDQDRPLIKSDGSYTYFASDIAYHRDKFRRGFKSMIDVWGADHAGHIKRMGAALAALTENEADLDVKICQLVRLFRAGEPVKMSKRAGTFVTLRDVVDEVGAGPVRFMMLYRKNDAPLDFDFAKVTEQSRDNPVFYVQYAHARASSVLRNVREMFEDLDVGGSDLARADLDRLNDDAEIALIRRIAQFPRIVEGAAQAHEPHRLGFYLYDLAGDFHGLWNRGKDLPQLRFIYESDRELTRARIALVAATQRVLALGLGILGVQAVHELH